MIVLSSSSHLLRKDNLNAYSISSNISTATAIIKDSEKIRNIGAKVGETALYVEPELEKELETEEKDFDKDLEKARVLDEGINADYQENELTEFMVDELGDLLELDEDEDSEEMERDFSAASEITHALEEDVFESWDEAEEAFMGFDKDKVMTENDVWTNAETETKKSSGREYFSYEEGRYSFNEDELKDIVTSSVQNALEKSIASSLVELAVSEIKNNVSGRV